MTGRSHSSRKQRELAVRQEFVFDAAEAVLAERGLHGASVDEIAKRAELSVGTLYNLFGSKENLYASLTERRIDQMRAAVHARVATPTTAIAKLHAAIDAIFSYFAEHERAFRVYVTATHGLEWNVLPQFGERVFRRLHAFADDMTTLCRLAVRDGALPRIDPALLALALVGTTNSLITRWVTERRGGLAPYQAGAHAILEALSAGGLAGGIAKSNGRRLRGRRPVADDRRPRTAS